jgi:nicotinamide riboside kinase
MSFKKIVVIGPESTGKSTLCSQLAEHYKTLWCPEYAREYLETNGMDYTYDDLLTIAKGQIALEEAMSHELRAMSKENNNSQLKAFYRYRYVRYESLV